MIESMRVAELFRAALGERPLWTVDDIIAQCAAGRGRLIAGGNSALMVEIEEYPSVGERVFEVGPAGGDLEEIAQAVPALEAMARELGCTQIHVTGRRGWVRLLRSHGFEEWATIARKVLT